MSIVAAHESSPDLPEDPPCFPASRPPLPRLVSADPSMRQILELARRAARGRCSVLILGETGVGKDVLARAIHAQSERAQQPLVCVDCTALPEALAESELFGHRRGSFTGALEDRTGLIESARRGTVFLDELGDLPPRIQAKLLRVIEAREVARVGETLRRSVDVRFVAATNRDLAADVAAGQFRRDLFYRIAAVTIRIPPLRDRRADIAALARALLAELAGELASGDRPTLSPDGVAALERHPWPGNIRELRNVLERALLMRGEPAQPLGPGELMLDQPPAAPAAELAAIPAPDDRRAIEAALASCAGNQSRAAKLLGCSRNTLLARLDRHGLPRPRKPRPQSG
jgi:two-component system response regulator AtoC